MNFFERQQAARRNTRMMLWLFAAAVVCIILAVDVVAMVVWLWSADSVRPRAPGVMGLLLAVPSEVLWLWSLITLAAILVVSAVEILKLRVGGGDAVARMLGARRVAPGSSEPLERRLLNVVEEMAIASGARVPAVYVMDGESGINAFAAGYDVSRSVVAVTRGTLETLNRDELQGVVGHEFSHIVNGDMALNIRMIGVLAGIVFIGSVGGFLMRVAADSDRREALALMLFGASLLCIGYIGLFFARLIKASVSREREYLADASSVQFTRNPDGLAGALDQIRASGRTSLIRSRRAEDVSHLFFGQGVAMTLSSLFATHPPLDERIRRVQPSFQSSAYRGKRVAAEGPGADAADSGAMMEFAGASDARAGDDRQAWGRSAIESVALVGSVDPRKVDAAQRILAALGPALLDTVRQPEGAAAVIVALALARDDVVMDEQLLAARTAGAGRIALAAGPVARELRTVGPGYFLPLADLALPALKVAPPDLQAELLKALQAVIHADRRVSMFGYVLFTLVRTQLEPRRAGSPARYKNLAEVKDDVVFLLSLVTHAGARRGLEAAPELAAAFAAGAAPMGIEGALLLRKEAIGLPQANAVLDRLRDLAPLPKALLVKGLFATVTADGTIRVIEAALMRMVGAVLDCPLPPLLESLEPDKLAA